MEKIEKIGLGTFPFAGVFGVVEEKDADEIISMFLDYGGKLIHVAPVYAAGKVEALVGNILKKFDRESYVLKSCCGWVINSDGSSYKSGKRKDVIESCENSLRTLHTDYLDIFMLHVPDSDTPYEETITAMTEMKEQGKAHQLCVSNVSFDQLKGYNCLGTVDYIQNRISLINRSIDEEMYAYCIDNNIKIIAYQGIERGLLTDRNLDNFKFASNDFRLTKPEFNETVMNEIACFVGKYLAPLAINLRISIASLVLKWLIDSKHADMSLYGISKVKYFKDVLDVDNTPILTKEIILEIEKYYINFENEIKEKYNKSVREFMGLV